MTVVQNAINKNMMHLTIAAAAINIIAVYREVLSTPAYANADAHLTKYAEMQTALLSVMQKAIQIMPLLVESQGKPRDADTENLIKETLEEISSALKIQRDMLSQCKLNMVYGITARDQTARDFLQTVREQEFKRLSELM